MPSLNILVSKDAPVWWIEQRQTTISYHVAVYADNWSSASYKRSQNKELALTLMLNYARMMPVYLSDMKLKDSKSTVYAEFLQGNWVVYKNPLPFWAIGADHALEHINRAMKVSWGLVGITLNPSARTKSILIAPELACLAREAEQMASYSPSSRMNHHTLSPTAELRETKNVISLCHTIRNFSNPFDGESTLLYNVVTKAIMLDKVKSDLCGKNNIGTHLFKEWAH